MAGAAPADGGLRADTGRGHGALMDKSLAVALALSIIAAVANLALGMSGLFDPNYGWRSMLAAIAIAGSLSTVGLFAVVLLLSRRDARLIHDELRGIREEMRGMREEIRGMREEMREGFRSIHRRFDLHFGPDPGAGKRGGRASAV